MVNVPCPTKDQLYWFARDMPAPLPGESIATYLDLHGYPDMTKDPVLQ